MILQICIEKGLVRGEKIFADGSLIQANASVNSLIPREDAPIVSVSPREYVEKVFEENPIDTNDSRERDRNREVNNSSRMGRYYDGGRAWNC